MPATTVDSLELGGFGQADLGRDVTHGHVEILQDGPPVEDMIKRKRARLSTGEDHVAGRQVAGAPPSDRVMHEHIDEVEERDPYVMHIQMQRLYRTIVSLVATMDTAANAILISRELIKQLSRENETYKGSKEVWGGEMDGTKLVTGDLIEVEFMAGWAGRKFVEVFDVLDHTTDDVVLGIHALMRTHALTADPAYTNPQDKRFELITRPAPTEHEFMKAVFRPSAMGMTRSSSCVLKTITRGNSLLTECSATKRWRTPLAIEHCPRHELLPGYPSRSEHQQGRSSVR
ncbi:hypothetical protein BJ546DRAFT_950750 [Cryomyces antarcticus]